MSKRLTDTDKFKKSFMRSLPGAYKLFWEYLCVDCNYAGIWHVDFEVAQIYLGRDMVVNIETALRLFNEAKPRVEVIANGQKWFIRTFIEFQYKVPMEALNPANKVHASVLAALIKEGVFKPLASPCQGATPAPTLGAKDKDKDKDKDRDRDRDRKFQKPTLQEIETYATTERLSLDARSFFDFYESKGWVVGRAPMRDWRAAARNWNRKAESEKQVKAEGPAWMKQ